MQWAVAIAILSLPAVYAVVYDELCEAMCVIATCKVLPSFIGCGYGWCGM